MPCPVCGAALARELFRAQDRFEQAAEEYALLECQGCGLVTLAPQPGPESWERLYPNHYYSYRPVPPRRRASRLGRMRERRKLRGLHLPPAARVLEIGCGAGAALDWHLQHGRECHGVEISRQAVALGTARGITMHLGVVEDAGFPDSMFHLIIAQQVFEHIGDPRSWLAQVRRILRPDGRLLLSVPNHASLNRRLFGRHWIGYDVPRHCYAFSPPTLRSVLRASGFRVLAIDHVANHYTLAASATLAAVNGRSPASTRRIVDRVASAWWARALCLPVALACDALRISDVVRVLAEPVDAT